MRQTFRGEKPPMPGNSVWRSRARRPTTDLPHPPARCRSTIDGPILPVELDELPVDREGSPELRRADVLFELAQELVIALGDQGGGRSGLGAGFRSRLALLRHRDLLADFS